MLNSVQLLGRCGKDAVIRNINDNFSVVEFSLATSEKWKDRDDKWQEKTQWHTIKLSGKPAYTSKYQDKIVKGVQVLVTGKIEYRNYDDKDGNKKYITEIIADTIKVVGGDSKPKEQQSGTQQAYTPTSNQSNPVDDTDDGLPF